MSEEGPIESRETLLRGIRSLSGREIAQRLLQTDRPEELVRALPPEDFYWVVKKLGEQDAVLLLEAASEEQWQYLLDLELWQRDRFDLSEAAAWLGRLEQADSGRLVQWLFHDPEGSHLVYQHLFRSVEAIVIENEEEQWGLPEGFFSVDGVHYIRALDTDQREFVEDLVREMADRDYTRFQAVIQGLAGVIPAELEEEMYRRRNVRLAEHGFLPHEEAMAVYAPLDPEQLESRPDASSLESKPTEPPATAAPLIPLEHVDSRNLFLEAVYTLDTPSLADRIRLEFAGLCNQILSADQSLSPDLDTLVEACRKASAYVNLGLERLCGKDPEAVAQALNRYRLADLFRVGFGLALKIKWEAERWLKGSWFLSQGLEPEFWGDYWGGMLSGLLEPKPRFSVGQPGEAGLRPFEWLSDLAECLKVIRRIMVLDGLLARLTQAHRFEPHVLPAESPSFRPLLFNLWARECMERKPSFSPLTPTQAKRFLERLRGDSPASAPPYTMPGWGETFLADFMRFAEESNPEAAAILREALVLIWQEFQEEYAWVSVEDLDERYAKFIHIRVPRPTVH